MRVGVLETGSDEVGHESYLLRVSQVAIPLKNHQYENLDGFGSLKL